MMRAAPCVCAQGLRKKSVRQKLSPIESEFQARAAPPPTSQQAPPDAAPRRTRRPTGRDHA
eukprot:5753979-Prymnesium_polylepis.1